MKKNVILGILIMLTPLMIVFAFIQSSNAEKQEANLNRAKQEATQNYEEAIKQEAIKLDAMERASLAQTDAEAAAEALMRCRTNQQ